MGFAVYTSATLPLADSDILLVEQGGNTRGVAAQNLGLSLDHIQVRRTSGQTIASGSLVPIVFDTTVDQSGDLTLVGGQEIDVTKDGIYLVSGGVAWGTNGNQGRRLVEIASAAGFTFVRNSDSTGASEDVDLNCAGIVAVSAGTSIVLNVFQDTGASLDTQATDNVTSLTVTRLRPRP